MVTKLQRIALATILSTVGTVRAGSTDDGSFTNFGADLRRPIFPAAGTLAIYKKKDDENPFIILRDKPVAEVENDWRSCVKRPSDGWVHCTVDGVSGWIKRADFLAGGEYAPTNKWPFRWWLHIASEGIGGEEGDATRKAVRGNPYLVAPSAFSTIFFHVLFDSEGRALSPRNGRPTGDRVFIFNKAVYLAPDNVSKRSGATWLFLNFYDEALSALCPSVRPESCMSAVNRAPGWNGIKMLYDEPPAAFRRKDKTPWFGASLVAFARHADPVEPLMYRVPDHVYMEIDTNSVTDAQRDRNREQLFCIADCTAGVIRAK